MILREWDGFDAYLFDIDGTLLNCAGATHYFAFCEALQLLSGRPLNLVGVTAHGNTDVGILRDALKLANVPEEVWRPRLAEARTAMGCHVGLHQSELGVEVLPGVVATLQYLRDRGASLGVATGNLEEIGRLKLQQGGLLPYFDFGGYSDDYEYRVDVFRAALVKARSVAGEHARVCVVGDTPSDVQAAKAIGLEVIAVATGIYSLEQLAKEKPDWCIASLEQKEEGASPRLVQPM